LPLVFLMFRNINLIPFPTRRVTSVVRIDLLSADEHC
jgi:hypothetical protein